MKTQMFLALTLGTPLLLSLAGFFAMRGPVSQGSSDCACKAYVDVQKTPGVQKKCGKTASLCVDVSGFNPPNKSDGSCQEYDSTGKVICKKQPCSFAPIIFRVKVKPCEKSGSCCPGAYEVYVGNSPRGTQAEGSDDLYTVPISAMNCGQDWVDHSIRVKCVPTGGSTLVYEKLIYTICNACPSQVN